MRNTKKNAVKLTKIALAVSAALCLVPNAYAVPANTQLPSGFEPIVGNASYSQSGSVGTITQTVTTTVNKWTDFSVGADATVNFTGPDNFNSVNLVNGGNVSEIYGQINANGGNIVIANPAGVQIGSSAQINVGSLYVTNKDLSALETIDKDKITSKSSLADITSYIANQQAGAAELMSLGGIVTGGTVTFDGERIVIDTDHLYKNNSGDSLDIASQLIVQTTDKDNVVLGYTAYDEADKTYAGQQKDITLKELIVKNENNETVESGTGKPTIAGYMWVENLRQLQAMETAPDANYALRNSIDANYTADAEYDYSSDKGYGFDPIGNEGANQAFTGKFDGLGYDIFDLNISRDGEDYVGLFGYADGAVIRNFTINSGNISGKNYTGAAVGYAVNSTIENIINTADVNGKDNTGGIVGRAESSTLSGLINTGEVSAEGVENELISNLGGIVGSIVNSKVSGETYNLGAVSGNEYVFNVGGIVGSAENSEILGTEDYYIYNQLGVTGAYNVGGIVGSLKGNSIVSYVENYGTVLAKGYTSDYYIYHTDVTNKADLPDGTSFVNDNPSSGLAQVVVKVANVGGIVGYSEGGDINDALATVSYAVNTGDVLTSTGGSDSDADNIGVYYNAGNVGGIIGSANNTYISNTENKENNVAGAHNVGGIVGYITGESTVYVGINNGGDITATGARHFSLYENDGFAQERIRPKADGTDDEIYNIGNIGGIVGYMYGSNVYVKSSANRGTVHSAYIENQSEILTISKAANVGGVVGKLDRDFGDYDDAEDKLKALTDGKLSAAVSYSYNTGAVQGYTGVGGVIGMMYNGEVQGSYNLGTISSTRQALPSNTDPLNMGGVVGDTTENGSARAVIYDVYNAGQVGDEKFNLYGRHVGGVVGRLSGVVEKAYNTGDIYNGFSVVGGIVGYWYAGSINNTFNTGNITVVNNNNVQSQVGGIVGAVDLSDNDSSYILSNSYNLGTLRSFQKSTGANVIGGILGMTFDWGPLNDKAVTISNVYTLGNLYVEDRDDSQVGAIVGGIGANTDVNDLNISYANFIKPEDDNLWSDLTSNLVYNITEIEYEDRDEVEKYQFSNGIINLDNEFSVDERKAWRIYTGTTPILNAFLPNTEDYFSRPDVDKTLISSIQYGTAANPLLTIINAKTGAELSYNWGELGITGAGSIAVYNNNSLSFTDFSTADGQYYGGTIFSEGDLTIEAADEANVNFGAGSKLYGSSVSINGKGNDVTVNGSVTAIGGDISITGDNIEIVGKLQAVNSATIDGIAAKADQPSYTGIGDFKVSMPHINEAYSTTVTEETSGKITITGKGSVEVLYGHLATGSVSVGSDGKFSVTGGSVYVDSDLYAVKGDIELKYNEDTTDEDTDGEVLLDLSNTATVHGPDDEKNSLHTFLDNHSVDNGSSIILSGKDGNEKITIDMWDNSLNNGEGGFALDQYDLNTNDTLVSALGSLNVNGETGDEAIKKYVYIWISDAEQLSGIQDYYKNNPDSNILTYNFALKNNIDASVLTSYEAIGTGSDPDDGFTGTFDGRDYRIVGLSVGSKSETGGTVEGNKSSAGIFSTIGSEGTVTNLRVYASEFYGNDYAGAIAGVNNGTVTDITTLGNHVEAFGSDASKTLYVDGTNSAHVGASGGIAGINNGTISDVSVSDSIVAGDPSGNQSTGGQNSDILATAGGVAGINYGSIENVTVDSAITANQDTTYSLGGIVGYNAGKIENAANTGVTHGEYGEGNITSDSVGGIVGVNVGYISGVYNGSDVTGGDNVGGVVGYNYNKESLMNEEIKSKLEEELKDKLDNEEISSVSGTIENAVNAGDIMADFKKDDGTYYEYNGGLVGYNSGTVSGGRNAGEIYGGNNVGGMVGYNAKGSTLKNLSNAVFASITGEKYVGGIAGRNAGTISATVSNLENYGKIYGQNYVGGIAGANEKDGKIVNTVSSISLYVKDTDEEAKYFGGVVGQNSGEIVGATNRSDIEISASESSFVGGIIGQNTGTGTLTGTILNEGKVSGKQYVGGIIGENLNETLLDNSEGNVRLVITNTGTVTGGGAAGIFYSNDSKISNVDLINTGEISTDTSSSGNTAYGGLFGINEGDIENSTLTNKGTVSGDGIVGGLIGENSGSITDSILTNSGSVTGTGAEKDDSTGGLIGKNSGVVDQSSLINTVDAKVEGKINTGGLIGYNTGTITGGRTEKAEDGTSTDVGYYKYQIYNNGSVVGSSNVGGLIGYNAVDNSDASDVKTGLLTAAYNTGTVSGGDNVGGVVGNNAGSVDQVFNTVMTADGRNQEISGSTNVGGIIGNNTGTLSDSYSTSEVKATAVSGVAGNAVGNNSGYIRNVYSSVMTGMTDKIIGKINNLDDVENVYASASTNKESYGGFDFDDNDEDGTKSIWKIYEGYGNPLLKVFLTSASYEGDSELTYNGKDQSLSIDNVIAVDKKEAYNNNNSLLVAAENKNAGKGYLAFYSQQIDSNTSADGVFNPNNLGYDITQIYTINQKELSISDILASIVYGNQGEKGYTVTGGELKNVVAGDDVRVNGLDLSDSGINNAIIDDSLYAENKGDRVTGDFGIYKNCLSFSGLTLTGDDAQNYLLTEISITGDVKVTKAKLDVTLDEVSHTYGNADDGIYSVTDNFSNQLVNSDKYGTSDIVLTDINDQALTGNTSGRVTNNVGEGYTWSASVDTDTSTALLLQNYDITISGTGKSAVNKAELIISVDNKQIIVGDTLPEFTGTDINDKLVNGDKLSLSYSYDIIEDHDSAANTIGDYVIGILSGNSFYSNLESLLKAWDGFSNYEVSFTPGTLKVKGGDEPEPTPAVPELDLRSPYGHVYQEGWDRQRNFRERKAEVYFHEGGVNTPESF